VVVGGRREEGGGEASASQRTAVKGARRRQARWASERSTATLLQVASRPCEHRIATLLEVTGDGDTQRLATACPAVGLKNDESWHPWILGLWILLGGNIVHFSILHPSVLHHILVGINHPTLSTRRVLDLWLAPQSRGPPSPSLLLLLLLPPSLPLWLGIPPTATFPPPLLFFFSPSLLPDVTRPYWGHGLSLLYWPRCREVMDQISQSLLSTVRRLSVSVNVDKDDCRLCPGSWDQTPCLCELMHSRRDAPRNGGFCPRLSLPYFRSHCADYL
jgi:hypothetical protein